MAADEGKRRVAAILAADVAGYSRLMADDERATVRTLTDYREVFAERIAAHEGRVVDTAGDSVLAVFDSVVEAVEAAVETQAALGEKNEALADHRRMYFRIGLNFGDIIVRDDGTVYGDGVNVAARLEGLATPGGIMLSDDAHRYARGKASASFAEAGSHEVKNIAEPVLAWRVAAAGEAAMAPRRRPRWLVPAVAAAVLAVAAGVGIWATINNSVDDVAEASVGIDSPTLAIVPFSGLIDDAGLNQFAVGLTAELSNALSKFSGLRLVQAGGEGSGYSLSGRLQQAGSTFRVVAELIDNARDEKVWGATYEAIAESGDTLAAQSDIAARIASNVADPFGAITREEIAGVPAGEEITLSLRQCISLAKYSVVFGSDVAAHSRARTCLQALLSERPDHAETWAWLALIYAEEANYVAPAEQGVDPRAALYDSARETLKLSPQNQVGLFALGIAHFLAREYQQAKVALSDAIERNPNDTFVVGFSGLYLAYTGEWEKGLAAVDRARTLNEDAPKWLMFPYAFQAMIRGDFSGAVGFAQQVAVDWDHAWSHAALAVAYAHLDRMREARASVARIRELDPKFAEQAEVIYEFWFPSDGPLAGLTEIFMTGLEKAGLFDVEEAERMAGPDIASVAVLPFDDLSASAEYAFLAAGLHENIIASLSQARRLFVPARYSTLQYEDADRNLAEVAQTLSVAHVLEGSIQVAGDSVRIVMQLIDASTGGHVWAERYERLLDDVFALQDDIAFNVVTALQVELTEGPQLLRWRGGTHSLEAWAKYQDGVIELRKFSEAGVANAVALLSEAVDIDPDFALAWAYRGWAVAQRYGFGFTDDESVLSDGLKDADRALELDQSLSVAYALKARVHHIRHEFADAVAMGEKAIELDPNGSLTRAAHSEKLATVGRPQDALAMLDEAMRLMPVYPDWYLWDKAHALLLLGRYGEAGDIFLDYHQRQPGDPDRALTLVALSQAGRLDEVQSFLAWTTAADPDFSIERVRRLNQRTIPYSDPAILEAHLTTLRELGVPEQPPNATRPIIAVLPFENMSGDPEQAYFADGITEDIITALTRFPELQVIGRTRMFQYKGRTLDIGAVHEETGAAYIVEGSVRRDQSAVRITAQVTDVNAGALLWSDNYQRDLEAGGIFHIQDDIMQQVVGSIAGQYGALTSAQARGSAAAPIRSLGARDCVYRGHQYFRELRWEDHAAMRDCLEQATETDPSYADAWALLASIYAEEHSFDLNPRPDSLDRALRAAQQAVEHDSSSTLAQQALAEARFYRHEKDLLMAAVEAAQSLNPNDSGLLMTLGFYVAYAGEWEKGAKLIRDGVALNARLPTWYHYPLFYKAMGERDYDAALAEARQFNEPDAFWTPAAFAAAYGQLGRLEEARVAVKRLLELYPDFGEHAYAEYRKWIFDEAVVEHSIDGLRKAGLEIPSLSN